MGKLRAHIQRVLAAREKIEIFGKSFPGAPGHALVERRAGNILHAFHQFDQLPLAARRHRRKAHAAIAHHHGGDAVRGRRIDLVVPGHLAVVMGMDIHPARRRQRAIGGDRLPSGLIDLSARNDLAVLNPEVAVLRRRSSPVHDVGIFDEIVEHGVGLLGY